MPPINCFKAYDIRGKLGTELDSDIAYRIGRAMGDFLKPKTIVVGGDVRLTSSELKEAVSEGLMDAGVDVIDLGITGTEEIYFATSYLGVDGGIEVTASHNPIDYNGMKLVREGARPISAVTGLEDIRAIAEKGAFNELKQKGAYKSASTLNEYIDHLLTYINLKNITKPLKLVINSGNGTAGHVINELEKRFLEAKAPIEIIKVHNEPDGTFPNGIPNPLLPENRQDTIDAVLKNKANMGIAFDGDFDRCFLFDEKGGYIEGYYIVGLLAEAFLEKTPGSKIVYDTRLTWNTIETVTKAGGTPVQSKSGHSFMKEKMREVAAVYGGEMSGHHYFRDFSYCDSGMIPWLLATEMICLKGVPLSEMVEKYIIAYPSPGEINSKLNDTKAAIEATLETFGDNALRVEEIDGISVEFENWRFNLRSSNTEPLARLNVETRGDIVLMKEKTKEVLDFIRQF